MRLFFCSSPPVKLSAPFPPPSAKPPPPPAVQCSTTIGRSSGNLNWPKKHLLRALTGALSVGLLLSSPSSFAFDSPALGALVSTSSPPSSSPSSERCVDDGGWSERAPEPVTNEGIVEEAWEVVNDGFFDAVRHRWSPEAWLQKREDLLGTSIHSRSKAHDIIRRMLASLGDPYTRYVPPEEFSKMARYDLTGVGINLRDIPDDTGGMKLKVLGLLLDGPAHTAGVRQGDEVLSVNGVDVKGKSAFEVSTLLQGPNETYVTMKVKHGDCGPIQTVQVQRKLVARTPVFYRLEQVENGTLSVGYIRLKEFNALARKDLITAMKRLQDLGASYFIIDLRDNLGGLVQAGIETAKLFLDEGEEVIYTVGRDPYQQKAIVAEAAPLFTGPVILLVNSRTASASEIVASALHDNCKAVLVGERTFGKGLIQSVFELRDGSGVVITVGKYVTRNHKDINGNGIQPDFQNIPAWSEVAERLSRCNALKQG